MQDKLKKQLSRFYAESEKEESFDLGEMAVDLVPRLHSRINRLEKIASLEEVVKEYAESRRIPFEDAVLKLKQELKSIV